jgi:hypothetical protein
MVRSFHVIGFARAFAHTAMRFFWKHQSIGVPEIAEAVTPFVGLRDAAPKLAARLLAAISNDKGNNLASSSTHRCPEPAFVHTLVNKGPNFIQFQGVRRSRGNERLWDGWSARGFSLTNRTRLGA